MKCQSIFTILASVCVFYIYFLGMFTLSDCCTDKRERECIYSLLNTNNFSISHCKSVVHAWYNCEQYGSDDLLVLFQPLFFILNKFKLDQKWLHLGIAHEYKVKRVRQRTKARHLSQSHIALWQPTCRPRQRRNNKDFSPTCRHSSTSFATVRAAIRLPYIVRPPDESSRNNVPFFFFFHKKKKRVMEEKRPFGSQITRRPRLAGRAGSNKSHPSSTATSYCTSSRQKRKEKRRINNSTWQEEYIGYYLITLRLF